VTRSELLARVEGIEGYLSEDEAWALYLAASACKSDDPRIVEIGSYKGRSAVAIGSALAERGRGMLFAVDPHAPTGKASYTIEHGDQDTYAEFNANIARAGVATFVTSIRATSKEARDRYDGRAIDMLFVDGSHDYDDVLVDIDTWAPLLAENAIVAFNDTYAPGVNRALRERVDATALNLGDFRHVNNTLFARRRGRTPNSFELALYFYTERLRFRLLKLTLRGLMETAGIIYAKPSR
jgi:predicted O-methyltransferase YrrM